MKYIAKSSQVCIKRNSGKSYVGKLQGAMRKNNINENNLERKVREGFPEEVTSYL